MSMSPVEMWQRFQQHCKDMLQDLLHERGGGMPNSMATMGGLQPDYRSPTYPAQMIATNTTTALVKEKQLHSCKRKSTESESYEADDEGSQHSRRSRRRRREPSPPEDDNEMKDEEEETNSYNADDEEELAPLSPSPSQRWLDSAKKLSALEAR